MPRLPKKVRPNPHQLMPSPKRESNLTIAKYIQIRTRIRLKVKTYMERKERKVKRKKMMMMKKSLRKANHLRNHLLINLLLARSLKSRPMIIWYRTRTKHLLHLITWRREILLSLRLQLVINNIISKICLDLLPLSPIQHSQNISQVKFHIPRTTRLANPNNFKITLLLITLLCTRSNFSLSISLIFLRMGNQWGRCHCRIYQALRAVPCKSYSNLEILPMCRFLKML